MLEHVQRKSARGAERSASPIDAEVDRGPDLRGMDYAAGCEALAPQPSGGLIQRIGDGPISGDPGAAFDSATRGAASEIPYRGKMEAAFGQSFANVQAYKGRAAEMDSMGAVAAARNESVVFASQSPGVHEVAHELAHVAQNRLHGSNGGVAGSGAVSSATCAAEQEADAAADAVVAGRSVDIRARPGGGIQLKRGIRVGRKARVDLSDQGDGLGARELAEIRAVPDQDHYDIELTSFKWKRDKPLVWRQRNVGEAKVTPNDLKEFEQDRCEDIAKSAIGVKGAIGILKNWSAIASKIPITKLDEGQQYRLVMKGFGEQNPKLFAEVMLQVYETPELQPLLGVLGSLQSTGLHPLAQTHQTWTEFAELQLDQLGKLGYEPGKGMSKLSEDKILAVGKGVDQDKVGADVGKAKKLGGLPLLDINAVCPDHGKRDWEILGRTVIFHPGEVDKGFVAVKLAKKGEDLDELYKEGGMQRILNLAKKVKQSKDYDKDAEKLGLDPEALRQMDLRSTFPEPVGVFMLEMPQAYSDGAQKGVARGIEKQFAQETKKNVYPCFVYRTNDYDYFQYINRAKDPRETAGKKKTDRGLDIGEMQKGTSDSMHDIFATASQSWMFTQLIDLYHHNQSADVQNSQDLQTQVLRTGDDRVADGGGRFLVLLDLLRKVGRDRGPAAATWGMGRIDNIENAVGYPNVRKTGVADVGDARSLTELLGKVKELQGWLAGLKEHHGELFQHESQSPWKVAFSPQAVGKDPKKARELGFLKPDLDLAKDVGAAMRRYDGAVKQACRDRKFPPKNECGFLVEELTLGIRNPKEWTTDPETLAEGRLAMRDKLVATCGLDPKNHSHLTMCEDAYDAAWDPKLDPPANRLEKLQLEKKAKLAQMSLDFVKGSKHHQAQEEEHALFKDVKHLLYPAEQEGNAVTPYVMTAYLSEYFISHLLLTGTYFCKDEKMAARLKKELALGRDQGAKQKLINELRLTLIGGCADAVIGFCGLDKSELQPIIKMLEGFCDSWKLARQVAFFMTDAYADVVLPGGTVGNEVEIDSEKAALQDKKAMAEMIRLGVYDKSDNVAIDDKDHRMRRAYTNASWGKKGGPGFGPDLGTYNGQMPIKEFEALSYRLVPYLMFKQMKTRG